jgi:uncharacterized membrane protein
MSTLSPPAAPPSRPATLRSRKGPRIPLVWWPAAVLSLLVAAYAAAYVVVGPRMYVPDLRASFLARPWGIYTHAFFGSLGLAVGPWQFLARLRARRPGLHRALGKLYVASASMVGASGLYMAAYAFGGPAAKLGFGLLAVTLLTTTGVAFARIRHGDVEGHRAWMLRSFAILFAAVTLRIELPLLVAAHGGDFAAAYRQVAWTSWVPNLLAAEAFLAWKRRRPLRAAAAA